MKSCVVGFFCYILVTTGVFGQASGGGGVVYQGLTNNALGNATITIACCVSNLGSGGQDGVGLTALFVTNLGSGGQDGVSISLPANLTSLDVATLPLDVSNTLPVGAYVRTQVIGPGNGVLSGVLGTVTETKAGTSNYVVSADYSAVGATTFTVEAYLHGVLVATVTNQPGSALAVAQGPPDTMGTLPDGTQYRDTGPPHPPMSIILGGTPGMSVTCDHFFIIPEKASQAINATALNITASQVPALTIIGENESLIYQGLTNTSLGSAAVSVSCCVSNLGSGGQDGVGLTVLYVTNLGSSGQDGVSITLPGYVPGGSSTGHQVAQSVAYGPLDPSNTLPAGAYIQEQAVGTGNGITNGVLGTVTVTKAGTSNYSISADYSALGASTYTAQAFLQGVLVAQASGLGGSSLAQVNIPPNGDDIGDIVTPLSQEWLGGNATLRIGTSASVQCDHLIITPENVASAIVPSAFQIVASQVPSLTIFSENESLIYQGLTNTMLGAAAGQPACCVSNLGSGGQDGVTLYITNLGSSGQDGVSITLPGYVPGGLSTGHPTGMSVAYEPLDLSNTLPVGAYVQEQAIGTGNGITNGVLGTVTMRKAGGGNYVFSADYSAMGASMYTAQAYLQGVLVAQATGLSGASLATANIPPNGDDIGDIVTPLSQEWLGGNATLTIGTSASVQCDHLIIIPENVARVIGPPALQIVASQVPSLTITSENVSMIYQGLTNTTLGNASESIACCISNLGSGGQDGVTLYITNLGSGGQDGVSFSLAANQSALVVAYEPLDPSNSLPVGAYVQEQVVGTGNGITNGVLGAVTVTKECAICNGTNYLISANFSAIGASTYTVQAYLNGVLEGQAKGQSGSSLASCSIWPPKIDWQKNDEGSATLSVHWLSAMTVTLTSSGNVTCDELLITPENVTLGSAPTALQLTASQVPGMTIIGENETLVYGGLNSTALGDATVAIACCVSNLGSGGQDGVTLYVTNLSSSGQDGVSLTMPGGASGMVVQWEDLDDSNTLPVGAFVQEQLVGTADDVTNGVLGTMTMTKAGTSNYVVSADFSSVGASNYTVQAYLQGALVGQATNQSGSSLASCGIMPPRIDWQTNDEGSATLSVHWLSATAVTLTGGANVTCDELLITPGNVTFEGAPTAMNITASEVPALTFIGEGVSPLLLSLSMNQQMPTLQWYGTAALQESADLKSWSDITNATSPYGVVSQADQPAKFYRLVFSP
jgi:hypothetical protein